MEHIDKAAAKAVDRVTARSPRASVPIASNVALPAAFVRTTDRDIPNRCWSSWIPTGGKQRELRRALDPEERTALQRRAADLRACMAPYGDGELDVVCEALATMFNSFPSLRGDTGSMAVSRVDAAARALEAFPAWAITMACAHIHRNGYLVTDRGGYTKVERHWPPSDADVVKVVEDGLSDRQAFLANAEAMLTAPVQAVPNVSAEERANQVESWRVHPLVDDIEAVAEENRKKLAGDRHRRENEERVEEWRRAGLEPPVPFVSLPLMLKLGWTIETVHGRATLVSPRKEPADEPVR